MNQIRGEEVYKIKLVSEYNDRPKRDSNIVAKEVQHAHGQLTSSQSPSLLYAAFIVVCWCPSADEWNRTLAPARAHVLGHNCRIVRAATVIYTFIGALLSCTSKTEQSPQQKSNVFLSNRNKMSNPNAFPFNISSRLSSEHFLYL